jgi:hypothetical protein
LDREKIRSDGLFEKLFTCASSFKTILFFAAGSEGTYVRVIGIVRSFQDSLHIVPHDTRPVKRPNSVRSRLRRTANNDIHHTQERTCMVATTMHTSIASLATSTTTTTGPQREEKAQHAKETPTLRRDAAWHHD